MVDYEIINKIKAALSRKGISQRELAERMSTDETSVSRWLAGKVGIGPKSLRQIEAVINILGNELGMSVARFTSLENIEVRGMIKEQFQRGDRLQAIIAIKCLDEGVNIPGIRTAFILASTTNPKEYIQRRGRVLRKAPNKPFAEIYDFVTLPRPVDSVSSLTEDQAKRDLALVKNEIVRMKEFGRLAMNPMDAQTLIWNIQDTYHLTEKDLTYQSEEEEFTDGRD